MHDTPKGQAGSAPRGDGRHLALAWAAAILLPSAAAVIKVHVHLLDAIPGALFIAAVAVASWFGYTGPSVAAIAITLLLFNSYVEQPIRRWSLDPETLLQETIFCLVAALIALLNVRMRCLHLRKAEERRTAEAQQAIFLERAREAEAEMRKAAVLYADQVKALSIAQQAGKSAAWVMDTEQRQVKWLPGGYEIMGRPFEDFEGRQPPISLVEAEDRPVILAALESTMQAGLPFQPEFRVRWPNGELHWHEARGVIDPDAPHIIRGTTFDITERKLAELSLLRVEKLAAVGRIASTIAHEINNPLASVTNLLYLALCDETLPEPVRGFLLLAQEELARLSNVTRLTLSYARPQTMAQRVDPVESIENVLFLFRVRLEGKSIAIERNFAPNLHIVIFVDELQRMLTNLIANAIDAVPTSGGRICLTLQRDGAHALLAVEDNGSGIPEDRAPRIFDPFFTTKEEVGTGIGLWVTKELAEKNGGSISFVSGSLENGMRTRFELRFPLLTERGSSL